MHAAEDLLAAGNTPGAAGNTTGATSGTILTTILLSWLSTSFI